MCMNRGGTGKSIFGEKGPVLGEEKGGEKLGMQEVPEFGKMVKGSERSKEKQSVDIFRNKREGGTLTGRGETVTGNAKREGGVFLDKDENGVFSWKGKGIQTKRESAKTHSRKKSQ